MTFTHYRNFFGYLFPGAALVIIGWFFLSIALTFSGVPFERSGLALVAGLTALFTLYVVNTQRLRSRRRRPLEEAGRRAASIPVATIAASGGRAHIRGRVRVVEAASTPMGGKAAAYFLRVSERIAGRRRAIQGIAIREAMGSGTFIVEDDTGLALIDDDAFFVAPLDSAAVDWNTPVRIIVQEGDVVEVVGPAERRPATEYPAITRGEGYRAAPSLLVFDGTPMDRVLILADPTRS